MRLGRGSTLPARYQYDPLSCGACADCLGNPPATRINAITSPPAQPPTTKAANIHRKVAMVLPPSSGDSIDVHDIQATPRGNHRQSVRVRNRCRCAMTPLWSGRPQKPDRISMQERDGPWSDDESSISGDSEKQRRVRRESMTVLKCNECAPCAFKRPSRSYPQFLWTSLWINPRIAASNRGDPWIARKSGDECWLAEFLMRASLVA